MKKNILTTILPGLIFLITFISCEDQIDIKPVSTISSSTFWQDEEDVKSATYGMYNQFRSTFDIKTIIWGEFRTGFLSQGSSTPTDWNELWNNTMNPSNVGTNWADMYLLINDANLILSKAKDIPFNSEAEKNHILGQAYFVRAYTYFQIVKIWGDAPIVTVGFESTDQDLLPARSPKANVFAQIKADIDNALSLLSVRKSVNYIGSSAANMLKADVYLWTAKLENGGNSDLLKAQTAINAVLTAGFTLEPNFATVFRNDNNAESIFSVFYSELETGAGARNGSSGRTQSGTHPSHITVPSLELTPAALRNIVPTQPSPQWLNLSAYFRNNILKPSNIDSRTTITWKSESTPTGQTTSWINKYIGEVFSGTRLPTSDFIIYRFAEAILFKAEIESALGNPGEAITQLNKIAKRAYGVDNYYSGLNPVEIDNTILNERILEFVLEGKMWFDIQRFGQAFQRIPSLVGREGANEGNVLLFPVAQDVLSRNRNVIQTIGY